MKDCKTCICSDCRKQEKCNFCKECNKKDDEYRCECEYGGFEEKECN